MDQAMPVSRRDFIGGATAWAAAGCSSRPLGQRMPAVRFGFITDCHYAAHIDHGDLRKYPQGLGKVRAFAEAMNRAGVDFVVEGGDFKDLGRTRAESLAYLDAVEAELARFHGPRYHVLGNHDHDNLTKEEFLSRVANGDRPAKAYYAFTRGGVRFIVLDACYRPDGAPYCRGDFRWQEAFLPDEQVAFLEEELKAAEGPCVPIVHQQLDAEDVTCIRNAAAVRAVIERSGKVRCVLQGHLHEGAFREVNGIGYYTGKASVIGEAPRSNAFSLVEVFADGSVAITGYNTALSAHTRAGGGWEADAGWRSGHYQVHFIYTGRGESMLHLFPDGTSMLVDCGDSMRFAGTPQEVPLLPDLSRRAGEWVARYVARVNPKGRKVDYFHLSHYHEDHAGGERWQGGRISSPTGDYGLCGLGDAARFLEFGTVVDRAWPTFDDPLAVLENSRDGAPRHVKAVYAALAAKGAKVERFRLGAHDQFLCRSHPSNPSNPSNSSNLLWHFDVFNLCANGRYVGKDGSVVDLFADEIRKGAKSLNENAMSCGIVVTYGKFRYFSAGDFSAGIRGADGKKTQIEDLLAEAVGPVAVAKASHHGHHSMYPALVKALRPRVWTACVLDQQHMTDDTCARLADRKLYKGERTILPTYMPIDRSETPDGRAYLADVPAAVRQQPCHVVLDVPEGGETFTMTCIDAAEESGRLVAQFGYFT